MKEQVGLYLDPCTIHYDSQIFSRVIPKLLILPFEEKKILQGIETSSKRRDQLISGITLSLVTSHINSKQGSC